MKAYSYAIIKENSPYFKNESVLLENKYKEKMRYAMILKSVHADGSESITTIFYSNDLQDFQERANKFISWYNYPIGIAKDIQGYLREI